MPSNSKQHRTGHSVTEKNEKRHWYTAHRVKGRKHSSTASTQMLFWSWSSSSSRAKLSTPVILPFGKSTIELARAPKSPISDLRFTYHSVGKQSATCLAACHNQAVSLPPWLLIGNLG
ncbi:hypothetical protein L3X38_041650 [Prunus dulcis]|uniref:Uncharacterized protein n=1 Tax=Prunus dulcis TaxID=3755 RepID=A0AAD4UV29_PRUDU|nr:hypothetical protein L3X38_041650 [Prunus dulcis]